MSAARHPGVAELASDCDGNGCASAAALVRAGLTSHAAAVSADLTARARHRDTREVWAAQVTAWAEGRLDALAASNAAWRRHGCTGCALAALQTGGPAAGCAGCAAAA